MQWSNCLKLHGKSLRVHKSVIKDNNIFKLIDNEFSMKITSDWREYHSNYRELSGDGFIAPLTSPEFLINGCSTEAFVGVSNDKKRYVPSIARIWDHEPLSSQKGHGVQIYFFDEDGKLLGGQEGGGRHQFPPESIGLERRTQLIRIMEDFMLAKPDLASLVHEIVIRL